MFFVFKQKTAYEVRISDWSSDVCSSDLLEPVFSFTYRRRILQADGSRREEEVSDHAYRLFRRLQGEDAPLPPAFVTAQTLEPASHVVMQAAVQRYIDSSVSKTINLPADISFEAFKDVYQQAYDLGRSEERRVGKEGVSTGRSRGCP